MIFFYCPYIYFLPLYKPLTSSEFQIFSVCAGQLTCVDFIASLYSIDKSIKCNMDLMHVGRNWTSQLGHCIPNRKCTENKMIFFFLKTNKYNANNLIHTQYHMKGITSHWPRVLGVTNAKGICITHVLKSRSCILVYAYLWAICSALVNERCLQAY